MTKIPKIIFAGTLLQTIMFVAVVGFASISTAQEDKSLPETMSKTGNNVVVQTKLDSDYKISLDFESEKVDSSEPIVLNVTFENLSDKNVRFAVTNVEALFSIRIENSASEIMPLTRYGQRSFQNEGKEDSLMRVIQEIKPQEKRSFKILLNRLYDMSIPGEYSVTATKTLRLNNDKGAKDVLSNTAKVYVGGFDASERPNPTPAKDAE